MSAHFYLGVDKWGTCHFLFVGAIRAHFGPISGRTTRCIFCLVLLGFTLPSRVGCVQRSQRRLRARSHRLQHRPKTGGWLMDCTGRESIRQRCSRTCEIHLGANRQELICFSRSDCGGSRFWILTQPSTRVGECKLASDGARRRREFRVQSPRGSCWGSERWDTLITSK